MPNTHEMETFHPLLKEGDILIALDPCEMEDGSGPALTVGKEYPILYADKYGLKVQDDTNNPNESRDHLFCIEEVKGFNFNNEEGVTTFFELKK